MFQVSAVVYDVDIEQRGKSGQEEPWIESQLPSRPSPRQHQFLPGLVPDSPEKARSRALGLLTDFLILVVFGQSMESPGCISGQSGAEWRTVLRRISDRPTGLISELSRSIRDYFSCDMNNGASHRRPRLP